jgi:DNA repair ATPase RecN
MKECEKMVENIRNETSSKLDEVRINSEKRVVDVLEKLIKEMLEIDVKSSAKDTLEQTLTAYIQSIKDNFKGTQQLDSQNLQQMKECWEQVNERLKQFSLGKYRK